MALVNEHFLKLPGSYLFSDIAKKVNTFKITHPKQDNIMVRMCYLDGIYLFRYVRE